MLESCPGVLSWVRNLEESALFQEKVRQEPSRLGNWTLFLETRVARSLAWEDQMGEYGLPDEMGRGGQSQFALKDRSWIVFGQRCWCLSNTHGLDACIYLCKHTCTRMHVWQWSVWRKCKCVTMEGIEGSRGQRLGIQGRNVSLLTVQCGFDHYFGLCGWVCILSTSDIAERIMRFFCILLHGKTDCCKEKQAIK